MNEEKILEMRRSLISYYENLLEYTTRENHRAYIEAMIEAFKNDRKPPHEDRYGRLVTKKRAAGRVYGGCVVYCEETNQLYPTIAACAKALGVSDVSVSNWIKGKCNGEYKVSKVAQEDYEYMKELIASEK
jgi:hypothetical protein